ncbi:hypothetical protein LCGC14_0696800 [marine sediment metagenome]|uniref:Uncharacterized protein n=1 Tax=marine sediment metagenome TaxID=412755 RepID=A0A0F9QNR5_9ZZZZ
MGETSPGVDAFMEFPGIETNSIEDPAVRRAFGVINEYFKRAGVFSDQDAKQSTIDANATAIATNEALNSVHRDGNGSDHANVVTNTTHRTSNGSSHSFLDQSVIKAANVQFAGLKFGAGGQQVTVIDTNTSLGTSNSRLATQNAIKVYVDTRVAAKMDDTLAALQALNLLMPNSSGGVAVGEIFRETGGDVKWRVA